MLSRNGARWRVHFLLFGLIAFVAGAIHSSAQVYSGSVTGVVTDASGGVIPSAKDSTFITRQIRQAMRRLGERWQKPTLQPPGPAAGFRPLPGGSRSGAPLRPICNRIGSQLH